MNKLFLSLGVIAILLSFSAFNAPNNFEKSEDEDNYKNQVLVDILLDRLNEFHFDPKSIDDETSSIFFDEFILKLDYGKRFFTQSDIKELDPYRLSIDDLLEKLDFEFFDKANEIYVKRLAESENYYKEFLDKPFDFTKEEFIETDYDKVDFSSNKGELKDRWRKVLKFSVLDKLVSKMEAQKLAIEENDTTIEIKEFALLEEEARDKVRKTYDKWFVRLNRDDNNDRFANYINAIVNVFDTHTSYFPPKDKEDFDIKLSGKLEGIGASLQETEEYIKVVKIVPGAPCYLQGELEVDDLILKVAQGEEEPVDVVGMPLKESVQLIRGKKGTEVRLTVKKADGSIKVIPIIRDVVLLEETYAKSAILEENDNKIGYIKLPKFYADFKNSFGRRCASDIKTELEKLKEENVDGVILDLRSNGGGALEDVVRIGDHFIDEGPIVQIKDKNRAYPLPNSRQTTPGVVYDGPLIILVNSFSASASEILAAAIQDYGRGIVIGSASTYGKGTVQRFYDLDAYKEGYESSNEVASTSLDGLGPLGALKMTTQKFYRINGESTQHRGVIPDIILPDSYTYIETGEKEQDFAMPYDEIDASKYKQSEVDFKIDNLVKASYARIKENKVMNLIDEDARRRKTNKELTSYNMQLDVYNEGKCQRKEEAEKYKNLKDTVLDFNALLLEEDAYEMVNDTVKQKTSADWLVRLTKDIYLEEAMNVMGDMVK